MNPGIVAALAVAVTLLAAGPATAYVGPGAGVSLIGAVIGLVVAVVSAIGFVLLWPIRAMMRRRKNAASAGEVELPADKPGDPNP